MATSTNSRNLLLSTASSRIVTNQKSLRVSAPVLTFLYTSAGVLSGTPVIAVTATKQNTVAPVTWTSNVANLSVYSAATGGEVVTTDTSTTNTSVVYLRGTDFAALNLDSLRVTATATDVDVLTDSLTVTKLQPGSPGTPGASGTRYITVTAYLWSNTPPAFPLASKAATYTWSTNSYDVAPTTSWGSSAPASPGTGYTLYQASVIVSGAATDLSSAFNWNMAVLNQIGYREDGSIGPTGDSARVAYVVTTRITPPTTPTAGTADDGDTAPTSTVTNIDGTTAPWSLSATSVLTAGQYMYQVDGIYKPLSTTIVWGVPYLSNLKVGSLSALAVDTGNLTVSTVGSIKNVGGGYNSTGFFLGYDSTAYKFSVGSGTSMLTWDGTTLTSTGLVIKDLSGNVILSAGSPLPLDYVPAGARNNLLDASFWRVGAGLQWPENYTGFGGVNEFVSASGPNGNAEILWKATAGTGGQTAGGWEPTGIGNTFTVDTTKTYRFCVPIYHAGGTSQSYWGIQQSTVAGLNTTVVNTNPYFAAVALPVGTWYLFVGYVFPANSTGNNNDGAGVYNMATGELLATGNNWNWLPGITSTGTRAYQFYASTEAVQFFGKPRVDIADGGEPPLAALLASGSVSGRNKVTANTASTYIANAAIGYLQVGALKAQNIEAAAITTDKLLVTGRGAAINDDPNCQDAGTWRYGAHGDIATQVLISENTGNFYAFRSVTGYGSSIDTAKLYPVSSSKRYRLSCRVRRSSDSSGVFYLRLLDQLENQIMIFAEGYAITTNWQYFTFEYTPPTTVTGVRIRAILNWVINTGYHEITDIRLEEMMPASLIVDGAISAQKINITQGSITGRIEINSNQIVVYDPAGNIRVKIGSLA